MDVRTKVARACNILAMEGMDTIYGHVSARIEATVQVWMKPHTLGLEEVRPHDIITIDLDGNKLAGSCHVTRSFPSIRRSIASDQTCSASFTPIRHMLRRSPR
jgi:ribulose-5-phosphate 4-epimerase/fuculose-1-phosphate aldolase